MRDHGSVAKRLKNHPDSAKFSICDGLRFRTQIPFAPCVKARKWPKDGYAFRIQRACC